jgi:hypothetical protein
MAEGGSEKDKRGGMREKTCQIVPSEPLVGKLGSDDRERDKKTGEYEGAHDGKKEETQGTAMAAPGFKNQQPSRTLPFMVNLHVHTCCRVSRQTTWDYAKSSDPLKCIYFYVPHYACMSFRSCLGIYGDRPRLYLDNMLNVHVPPHCHYYPQQ